MNDSILLAYWTSSVAGFVLILLLSIPAFQHVALATSRRPVTAYRPQPSFYEDEDGEATAESIQYASKRTFRLSLSILACVTMGCFVCGLQAIFASPDWVQLGIWILLLFQSISLLVRSCTPTLVFSLGWKAGCSSLVAFANLSVQGYRQRKLADASGLQIAFTVVQGAAALLLGLLAFMIPRRPDVYRNGTLVDRQFTSSLLDWVTFSWAGIVLRKSEQSSNLRIDDLPEIDLTVCAETLLNAVRQTMPRDKSPTLRDVWWWILRSNRRALLFQLALAVPLSFLSFAPQVCLWKILQDLGGPHDVPWESVAGLGVSLLVTAMLDTIKYWISYNQLAIRTQEQLSLAVFDKALRLDPNTDCSASADTAADQDDEAGRIQSPINMVAVDAKSVADFFCLSFLLYESPLKLAIASAFLVRLVGWRSLLAGIVVMSSLMAANIYTVRKYSSKQGAVMSLRDTRLRMLTEGLRGIRQIKFSALETRWEASINLVRDRELRAQWAVYFWKITLDLIYLASPIVLSAICLSTYVLVYGSLSAATAFTAISVLREIDVAMTIVPDIISLLLDASISMGRIRRYLAQPDRISAVVPSDVIEFQDATVTWPGNSYSLTGLNLRFPKGALSIITGPTGSGKSLLLTAILGGSDILCGTVKGPTSTSFDDGSFDSWITDSAIAYVAQTPWMRRGTIKENILFGLPLSPDRYAQVLFACSLQQDLRVLPSGDQTEVEPHGANLSGGQQWRISFARALYSRAQTLIMDDIFSAVDVHTRDHLCRHALAGELTRGRTCVLVTHHLDLCLSHAEYLISLENGTVKLATSVPKTAGLDASPLLGHQSIPVQEATSSPDGAEKASLDTEQLSGGIVRWEVGKAFIKEGGNAYHWVVLAAAFLGYGGLMLGRDWWVSLWTSEYERSSTSEPSLPYYLGIYVGLSMLACVLGMFRAYFALSNALRASRALFRQILSAVLRAPLQWHNTVPIGRVLSRFSADLPVLDSKVGEHLHFTLEFAVGTVTGMLPGIMVNPLLIAAAGVLAVLYCRYARRYLQASRQVKNLENAAKGPILDHLDTCLSGLSTIKAYGQTSLSMRQFQDRVNRHARAFWHLWLLNRWLGFRINFMGAAFAALSAALVVCLRGIDASTAGFAISFTIEMSIMMALSIRGYADLEQDMNSVGRTLAYARVPGENYAGSDIPSSWPSEGMLEVRNLVVGHASHLPPVLRGISFNVAPNERVGVVGRTGAGKSSLILALFRFLEASAGEILIDGVDISTLKVDQLRRRLAIIPQDPVIFHGTVRSNLDPFQDYEDDVLLAGLQAVGWSLEGFEPRDSASRASTDTASSFEADEPEAGSVLRRLVVSEKPRSPLDQAILEGGRNLSQGQRQLLCLARALIRRPKILFLDEATSAVDKATDERIQRTLRDKLGRSVTVLVIAHRLSTIVDFDRVLVMDGGRVVEFGPPRELMGVVNGVFRGMVEQDSERGLLMSMIGRS